jgi:hypothetical protein
MISGMTATRFSLMIFESTGVVCAVESMCHPWKQFRWWFLSPRDCFRCRIHASPVEAVSLMISESRGTVCVVDFMRYGFETWKLVFWATPRKKTSENSWKHVSMIQRSDQMLCSFWRLRNHQRNCFHGWHVDSTAHTTPAGSKIITENLVTIDSEIINKSASTGDAWFDSTNSPWDS